MTGWRAARSVEPVWAGGAWKRSARPQRSCLPNREAHRAQESNVQSAVSMRWQAAHGVGKRIRGLRGGERAPNEHTIWKNSSARKTDCSVRHATPTLGNVWCFKYSAAGAVRTIGAMAVARPCMESAYSSSFARMGLKGERRHARVGRLRPDDVGATSLSSVFHEAQKGYEGYPVRPVGVTLRTDPTKWRRLLLFSSRSQAPFAGLGMSSASDDQLKHCRPATELSRRCISGCACPSR